MDNDTQNPVDPNAPVVPATDAPAPETTEEEKREGDVAAPDAPATDGQPTA